MRRHLLLALARLGGEPRRRSVREALRTIRCELPLEAAEDAVRQMAALEGVSEEEILERLLEHGRRQKGWPASSPRS